jgi:hypothetical protein
MYNPLQPSICTCNLTKCDLATVKTHPWIIYKVVFKNLLPSKEGMVVLCNVNVAVLKWRHSLSVTLKRDLKCDS